VVRGDSAYGSRTVVRACLRSKVQFSLVMVKNKALQRAIDSIEESVWTPVRYPNAVQDPDTGAWISDAEVAEVSYTAFAATKDRITARLVIRRVPTTDHRRPGPVGPTRPHTDPPPAQRLALGPGLATAVEPGHRAQTSRQLTYPADNPAQPPRSVETLDRPAIPARPDDQPT